MRADLGKCIAGAKKSAVSVSVGSVRGAAFCKLKVRDQYHPSPGGQSASLACLALG